MGFGGGLVRLFGSEVMVGFGGGLDCGLVMGSSVSDTRAFTKSVFKTLVGFETFVMMFSKSCRSSSALMVCVLV